MKNIVFIIWIAVHDGILSRTPVHYAAENGKHHVIELLLDNTEDATAVNAADKNGHTPLMLAALMGKKGTNDWT